MKVRYTIIIEETEDLKDWGSTTDKEAIQKIKDYLVDDPGYLIDSTWKSVTVEEIPDAKTI
jgi:hypothetical protein